MMTLKVSYCQILSTFMIKSETNLSWKVGLRSLWQEYRFESNLFVFGSDGDLGFQIGAPMHLTENVAVDFTYTYAVENESKMKSNISSFGLDIRAYF